MAVREASVKLSISMNVFYLKGALINSLEILGSCLPDTEGKKTKNRKKP